MAKTKTEASSDGQYVVVHDQISFRDPADTDRGALKKDEQSFLYASRGEELPEGVPGDNVERLLKLGAITPGDTRDAELAKAGLPPVHSLRSSPHANALPFAASDNEQTQIVKSVLAGIPGPENTESSRQELMKLPGEHLAVMARVLGVPAGEDATKADIVELILTGGENGTSAEEIAEQVQARDERQVAARDFKGEAGMLGTNVRSDGTDGTGSRTASDAQSKKAAGRSSSKTSADDK